MINHCVPCYPWDPELERLRRELQRVIIEDEKRRIRDEINRLRPYGPVIPFWPAPVFTRPPAPVNPSPSIEDVLRAIGRR